MKNKTGAGLINANRSDVLPALLFPTEWFLVTNTVGTSAALFLLLLMQHSQNRGMHAMHAKIDELIRSSQAGNHWIGPEQRAAADVEDMIAASTFEP